MVIAKLYVDGVSISAQNVKRIPSGISGATIEVTYSKEWERLEKTAVLSGTTTKDVLNVGNTIAVPAEVVAKSGSRFRVGFYGVAENQLAIPTLWADLGTIQPGTDPSGDESTNPQLPVWAQLQQEIEDLKNSGGGGGSGYSPTAKVEQTETGARITITDKDGTSTADVLNGKNGYTPQKNVDYFTEADKDEMVEKVKESGVLMYTEQTLTEAQKAQARANIGADEEWFEIADITSTEEVNSFYVNKDKNGNPFVCKRIVALMVLPSEIAGAIGEYFGGCNSIWGYPGITKNCGNNYTVRGYNVSVVRGCFTEFDWRASNTAHFFNNDDGSAIRSGNGFTDLLTQFFVCRQVTDDLYPVGTQLKVWGLKA